MNLFGNRPLSFVLCILLSGFVIFSNQNIFLMIASVIFAVGFLLFALFSKLGKAKRALSIACAAALLLGALASQLYFGLWFHADERFTDEVEIIGTITDIDTSDYSNSYTVRCDNINKRPASRYTIRFYLSKSDDAYGLVEGNKISFSARLYPIENSSDFDAEGYYFARGVCSTAEGIRELRLIDKGRTPISSIFDNMREFLTRHAKMLTNSETGGFICALIFGERDSLSGQVRLDFTRIGITHILALSGMHLAILSFGLELLLSALGIGKRPRSIYTVIFIAVYMAFTGFSVSVVRAGIMLILARLLSLLRLTHDSVTALFISVTLIIAVSPYSIYDTALWLSAFATLGVIIFAEYSRKTLNDNENEKARILRAILYWLSSSTLSSLFAISSTLFITTESFSGLSLLGPFATIIFSILAEIIMYLGGMMFIIGSIIPLGWILVPITNATTTLAGILSSIRGVYVSDEYLAIKILVSLLTVMFYLFVILNIKEQKHKRMFVSLIILVFISVYALAGALNITEQKRDRLYYQAADASDEFILRDGGDVMLICSAKYSKARAYSTVRNLENQRIKYVDKLYLTHYSKEITDTLEVLLRSVAIDEIYLPFPMNEKELGLLNSYEKLFEGYRSEIKLVRENASIKVGTSHLTHLYSTPYGEGTSITAFSINNRENTYAYLSSGMLEKFPVMSDELIAESSGVIFGSHGKGYSEPVILDKIYTSQSLIIIESNNLFIDHKSFVWYNENGCKIYSHPSKINIYYEAD